MLNSKRLKHATSSVWHLPFKEEYCKRKRLTFSCCKNSKAKPKAFRASTHGGLSQKTFSHGESQSCKDSISAQLSSLNSSCLWMCINLPEIL